MDTTVDALKNLYVAEGGTLSDVENVTLIPEMINAIAALVASKKDAKTEEIPEA